MVHYIRFLRTPEVKNVSQKSIEVTAVLAVTTDLGDSFLSENVTLIARLIDATKSKEILCTSDLQWKVGARALKLNITCSPRYVGCLVYLHMTTRDTIASLTSCRLPAIMDIYSAQFSLKPRIKSEPLVERRLMLCNKSSANIWEETGDSIARHIWFVVS